MNYHSAGGTDTVSPSPANQCFWPSCAHAEGNDIPFAAFLQAAGERPHGADGPFRSGAERDSEHLLNRQKGLQTCALLYHTVTLLCATDACYTVNMY